METPTSLNAYSADNSYMYDMEKPDLKAEWSLKTGESITFYIKLTEMIISKEIELIIFNLVFFLIRMK